MKRLNVEKKKNEKNVKLLYFWASPDGAEQLGAVADGGGSVVQRGGELGWLGEVVFLVLRRLVLNTWRMGKKQA